MSQPSEELKWPIKEKYQQTIGCPYWYAPILKGWIPCRFPALKLAGSPPCRICWRYYIYNLLLALRGKTFQTEVFQQKYLYPKPPDVCYCWDCGKEIRMTGKLAGKHCREIRCPYCGSTNVWRRPKS